MAVQTFTMLRHIPMDIYMDVIGRETGEDNFMNTIWNRCGNSSNSMSPVWELCKQKVTQSFRESVEHGRAWMLFKQPNNGDYIALVWVDKVIRRELGPLVAITETDPERGWKGRSSTQDRFDLTFKAVWDLRRNQPGAWCSDLFTHRLLADPTSAFYAHTCLRGMFPLRPHIVSRAYDAVASQALLLLTHLTPAWQAPSFPVERVAALNPSH